jgi:Cu(I)/Ag(I) efflux system membrane fusion protein
MKSLHFAFLISCVAVFAALTSCSRQGPSASEGASDVDYYTCTMHPSVHSHDPDEKCPICGMDLVPVKKGDGHVKTGEAQAIATAANATTDDIHEFSIPLDRQQLIGVTYAPVETKPLRRIIRTAGYVAATTAKHWDYVSRVDGYIHTMEIGAAGDRIEKGQVLMDIYSPDLVATENEYVDLVRMRDNGRRDQNPNTTQTAEHLLAGARARLRQWNVSDEQINELERTGAAPEFLQLNSPVSGIVEEIGVHQGRHVAVGDHLVDLVDLSSVWVWAEFYENELPHLKRGVAVLVTSSSLPGWSVSGTIAAVDPFLNDQKRTGRVRIDVNNADLKLRPDAYVDVSLTLDEGEGLTIPSEAVLPTGQQNIVFVDKGGGRLEPRFVQLGGKFGDVYQITGGLSAGERVVTSANFLVDAESKVQGALKSW